MSTRFPLTERFRWSTPRREVLVLLSAVLIGIAPSAHADQITIFAQHVRQTETHWEYPGRARYFAPESGECDETTTCCATNPTQNSVRYLEAHGWDAVNVPANHRIIRVEAYVRVGYSIATSGNSVKLRVSGPTLNGDSLFIEDYPMQNNDNCQWLYWDLTGLRDDWGSSGALFADNQLLLAVRRKSTPNASNVCRVDAFKLVITTECPPLPAPAAPDVAFYDCAERGDLVTWAPVSGATSYNVYRGVELLANTAFTSLTPLAACGTYCYEVAAVGPCGEGLRSPPNCVDRAPVAAPTGFVLESVCGAIRLRWNGLDCATYHVYRDDVHLATTSRSIYVDENPGVSAHCYRVARATGCSNPTTPTLCGSSTGVLLSPSAVEGGVR